MTRENGTTASTRQDTQDELLYKFGLVKDYIQLVYDHFKKQVNLELTGFLTSNHPAERNKISLSRCECTKKGFQGFWDTLYKIGSTYKRGCAERDLTQHNTFAHPINFI